MGDQPSNSQATLVGLVRAELMWIVNRSFDVSW
jgi:hypothetical protein